MNQEYLQGLHTHLGVTDDYNTWVSAVKDNDDYLQGLHDHLGVEDNYDIWKTAVFAEDKKEEPAVEEVETEKVLSEYSIADSDITISKQEMDDITSKADALPVVKTKKGDIKQTQFNPYAKGYGAYVAPREEVKYESYVFDEFLNEDKDNIEEAKQKWISKQRKDLLKNKLEERLEELEDEMLPWYSIPGVDPSRPIRRAKYDAKRAVLTSEFKGKEKEANKEYIKLSNKLTADKESIDNIDLTLNTLKKQYDDNPQIVTQEKINKFNDLITTRETAVDLFNEELDKINELSVKSQDFNTIADMTQRTYNNVEVVGNRISSRAMEFVAGLGDFTQDVSVPGLMKKLGGIDVQNEEDIKTLPKLIQPIAKQMGDVGKERKISTDKLREEAEKINKFTKHRQEFNKIDSLENFGEFVLDLFSEQLVNTAITVSTGSVGLGLVSASAAGDKMNQMNIDIEKYLETGGKEGQMVSPAQFYTAGLGYGLAEYVTERVALKQFKGARKAFNEAAFYDDMGKYSLNTFKIGRASCRERV